MITAGPLQPCELPVGGSLLRPWREDDVDVLWQSRDREIRGWNGGVIAPRTDALVLLGRRMDHRPAAGDAQIGSWTVPAARGRGLAAAAVDAVCRWAFAALPVDRIELCHAVDDTASRRGAEKAGFIHEGRLRRCFRYGDGRTHDQLLWARLDDDPAQALSTRS
ncbi:GNAT family N-acetyltransferase [Blastococcus sp. SYSU DS0541]